MQRSILTLPAPGCIFQVMKILIRTLAGSIVTAFLLLAFSGCETTPASSEITITPSTATLRPGETATFVASGGYDYRWSLSQPTYGTLSSLTGSSVTYTSIYSPSTNSAVSQVLTLVSYVAGATAVSTNTSTASTTASSYQLSTEAIITHLPPAS